MDFYYDHSDEYFSEEEYSDFEYKTTNPYDVDLNAFINIPEETPLQKLSRYICDGDMEGVQELLPTIIEYESETKSKLNGSDSSVLENGDQASGDEESGDEFLGNNSEQTEVVRRAKEIYLESGDTVLMAAAVGARDNVLSHLISCGLDVNQQLENSNKTALVALCMAQPGGWELDRCRWYQGGLLCLRALMEAGANATVKCYLSIEEYGNTAIHYAAANNHWQFLELLLHTKADVNAMNSQRKTALMLAAERGHVAVCSQLIRSGASPELQDKHGATAAEMAETEGHIQLADSLCLVSGSAQHNFKLYKLWKSYVAEGTGAGASKLIGVNRGDGTSVIADADTSLYGGEDNQSYNHSCIESFCLSIDAPYLVKLMEDQGLSISDLKFMDESSLSEVGVPMNDCLKIVKTAKDISRAQDTKENKVSMEYGKPLRSITLLEIMGNLNEHIDYMESHVESLLFHLEKNQQFYQDRYRIINKSTIKEFKNLCKSGAKSSILVLNEIHDLSDLLNKNYGTIVMETGKNSNVIEMSHARSRWALKKLFPVATVLSLAIGGFFIYKKYLQQQ